MGISGESLEPHKSAELLHAHFVTITVRIVRRHSIQRLLGTEPLGVMTLTRIGSGEKLVTKNIIALGKNNGKNLLE
jgi:hypothetical protein